MKFHSSLSEVNTKDRLDLDRRYAVCSCLSDFERAEKKFSECFLYSSNSLLAVLSARWNSTIHVVVALDGPEDCFESDVASPCGVALSLSRNLLLSLFGRALRREDRSIASLTRSLQSSIESLRSM